MNKFVGKEFTIDVKEWKNELAEDEIFQKARGIIVAVTIEGDTFDTSYFNVKMVKDNKEVEAISGYHLVIDNKFKICKEMIEALEESFMNDDNLRHFNSLTTIPNRDCMSKGDYESLLSTISLNGFNWSEKDIDSMSSLLSGYEKTLPDLGHCPHCYQPFLECECDGSVEDDE
jgi:hypothetical protein